METDWESMYRSWKEGLGWINRNTMFSRCDIWLSDMQESIWTNRDFGRTGNYMVSTTSSNVQENLPLISDNLVNDNLNLPNLGMVQFAIAPGEDEVMAEIHGDTESLDQFQWP
jgi:hypothetical protein